MALIKSIRRIYYETCWFIVNSYRSQEQEIFFHDHDFHMFFRERRRTVKYCFFSSCFLILLRKKSKDNSIHSVMQSGGNSFGGDVVLDTLQEQIFKSKYVRIFIMMFLIPYNFIKKYIYYNIQQKHYKTTIYNRSTIKLDSMSSLLLCAVFLYIVFSAITF